MFGIIKSVLGFRQFLLRGLTKVKAEWDLVCLAYNAKRLWALNKAGIPGDSRGKDGGTLVFRKNRYVTYQILRFANVDTPLSGKTAAASPTAS